MLLQQYYYQDQEESIHRENRLQDCVTSICYLQPHYLHSLQYTVPQLENQLGIGEMNKRKKVAGSDQLKSETYAEHPN
jgi:hypothetical protein